MNISKNKLKEIIQEELNVLLGLDPPYMGYDPGPESAVDINNDLLRSAEKAAEASSIATNDLNRVVSMLEHIERGGDLANVRTKIMNTLDNITDVVSELDVFHKDKTI